MFQWINVLCWMSVKSGTPKILKSLVPWYVTTRQNCTPPAIFSKTFRIAVLYWLLLLLIFIYLQVAIVLFISKYPEIGMDNIQYCSMIWIWNQTVVFKTQYLTGTMCQLKCLNACNTNNGGVKGSSHGGRRKWYWKGFLLLAACFCCYLFVAFPVAF